MSHPSPIADDEILLRHIPGGTTFQSGPDRRITSPNFRPRAHLGETYISVNRLALIAPDAFLAKVGGDPAAGSRVAWATAGAVRALGLRVVPHPIPPDDLGHAGIESTAAADLSGRDVQRSLAVLFRYIDTDPPG